MFYICCVGIPRLLTCLGHPRSVDNCQAQPDSLAILQVLPLLLFSFVTILLLALLGHLVLLLDLARV